MRALCDVNVLVALCHGGHEHHETAARWLKTWDKPGSLLICRVTHLGLLRLLNNPAALEADALTGRQVWELSDRLFADDRFALIGEPPGVEQKLRAFTSGIAFSPKLWQDAYLAAFAIQAPASLATFDKSFAQYKGLALAVVG